MALITNAKLEQWCSTKVNVNDKGRECG